MVTLTPNPHLSRDFHIWYLGDQPSHGEMATLTKFACFEGEPASWLNDNCPFFLMLIVPPDAAHLFDLNAAILGWLLLAIQP